MPFSGKILLLCGDIIKKLMKKDYLNIGSIITIFLGVVLYLVGTDYVYGSTLDWQSQHWAFPEYFRNLFYETKNLFPNFAFNIGGGQNIYYFSYYGLLSPIILISYLMPFIPMPYYIMGSSIAIIIISIILLYKWLYNRFDSKISFISTMLFMTSGPIILHSHRHIMFMIYIPFLIMALMGVDKYFEGKRSLLIVSIFLMIMSNYFYSVSAIVAISIYFIYKYLELNNKIDFKNLIIDSIKYVSNIFTAILMASIILLPTAYVILNGRQATSVNIDYLSLIMPSLNWKFLMYGAYSLGLTSIILYSIVENIIGKEKHNRFLAVIFTLFMLFPIIIYILNGTMYIEAKVLIPFIPLGLLLISNTLNKLFTRNYDIKTLLLFLVVGIPMIFILYSKGYKYYVFDFVVILTSFYLFHRYKIISLIALPLVLISLNNCIYVNINDKLVTKDQLNHQLDISDTFTKDIISNDDNINRSGNTLITLPEINRIYGNNYYQTSIYSSTNNLYYNNFYYNIMGNEISYRNHIILSQSKNILFNIYMGVKYLISDDLNILGYSPYKNMSDNQIYINEDVFPIAYVNSSLMSLSEYKKLGYPYNIEALMNNVVVDKDIDSNFTTTIEYIKTKYELTANNASLEIIDDVLKINANKDAKISFNLDRTIDGKVLILKFDMLHNQSCSQGDTWITILGMTNKLTCKEWKYHNKNYTFNYSISSNNKIDSIEMILGKGKYEIGNIEFYTIDYNDLKNISNNFDEFVFDKEKTKGDHIEGNIDVTKKGYFVLNIPYDKGFEILVDGKRIKYELVNEAFMGFALNEGLHHIEINYQSPYLNVSKYLSLVGFGLLLIAFYKDKKKKI